MYYRDNGYCTTTVVECSELGAEFVDYDEYKNLKKLLAEVAGLINVDAGSAIDWIIENNHRVREAAN